VNEMKRNKELEDEMEGVLQAVELARRARNASNIKTKQPLSELIVVGNNQDINYLAKYSYIIEEEINVKQVHFQENAGGADQYEIKLNFPTAGPKLGKQVGIVQKAINQLSELETKNVVEKGSFKLESETGEYICVGKEDLLINQITKKGVEMASNEVYTVLLNTKIDDNLRKEGLVRELIRAVQQYRKELNLPVEQRVNLTFNLNESLRSAVEQYKD